MHSFIFTAGSLISFIGLVACTPKLNETPESGTSPQTTYSPASSSTYGQANHPMPGPPSIQTGTQPEPSFTNSFHSGSKPPRWINKSQGPTSQSESTPRRVRAWITSSSAEIPTGRRDNNFQTSLSHVPWTSTQNPNWPDPQANLGSMPATSGNFPGSQVISQHRNSNTYQGIPIQPQKNNPTPIPIQPLQTTAESTSNRGSTRNVGNQSSPILGRNHVFIDSTDHSERDFNS